MSRLFAGVNRNPDARAMGRFFKLREQPPLWQRVVAGAACLALILLLWFLATNGKAEEHWVTPAILPSPGEVLSSFHSLWFDRALSRNAAWSLWRVLAGFGLATLIGVPLGILCGTWPRVNAFFAPISVFLRNVPISALVPLTLVWCGGICEKQKVEFIFIACVMFVVFDAARSVASVDDRYVQTALTLGASKFQVVMKVLVPLSLPDIFGSLRLLFGLAFGYIILAEIVGSEGASGGLGKLIEDSQKRGLNEHIYILLATITVLAYLIDRALYFVHGKLFPYREGK